MRKHPGEFTAAVRKIMERPELAGARFGVDVRDLPDGAPIFQYNAKQIFSGASTAKIPTSLCALALLGPDFRFRTKLVRTGPVDDAGTVDGDLILVASGDPNLSNRVSGRETLDFENLDHSNSGPNAQLINRNPLQVVEAFARGAHDAGIRRVTGTILIDVHLFDESYREAGTGTTVSPVAVNDNQIDIEVTAGAEPGDPITYRQIPQSGYIRFIDRARTGASGGEPALRFSKEELQTDGSRIVVISGAAPRGSQAMASIPVESPSRFARTLLVEALTRIGVIVEGGLLGADTAETETSTDAAVVAEHVSPRLGEATRIVLKVSQNLHSEMLIPVIGATLQGARGEQARLAGYACCVELLKKWGVGTTGLFQGDACGARGYFSPEFMSRLLVRAASSDIYEELVYGLPVMGRDGTLWDIQPESPAAGKVRAKTGTLGFGDFLERSFLFTCKGLAGYVDAMSGRRIAFTLYLNNFLQPPGSGIDPGQVLGEIASAIFEYL